MNTSLYNDLSEYISCSWSDYDRDGDQDLFLANYDGRNALYRNDGNGVFTKLLNTAISQDSAVFNGGSWGDIDNDGDMDLFVTAGRNYSPDVNYLFINHGRDSFSRFIQSPLTTDTNVGYASGWVDIDNNGFLDMYVTHSVVLSDSSPNLL